MNDDVEMCGKDRVGMRVPKGPVGGLQTGKWWCGDGAVDGVACGLLAMLL
jgi:hypothetical protein